MMTATVSTKPTLRGVSHQIAALIWPLIGFALFAGLEDRHAVTSTAIYTASATTLFAISALYHRVTWSPVARKRMRRLDHGAIFLFIAGTYTPICVVGMGLEAARLPLAMAWVGAALGMLKSVFWIDAPKWVIAALAVVVGWAPMVRPYAFFDVLDAVGATLFVAGGALFTLGAVTYARKRPNPWPATFGYHEIFHLLVVLAAVCHLILIVRLT